MANRFAVASGNFNATSTWATTAAGAAGASVPVAGDVAIANNRTVTITADATCTELRNDNFSSATAGGGFILNDSVTLTANVIGGSVSASRCVTYQGTTSAAIVGNCTGGSGSFAHPNQTVAVYHNGSGTLTVTGTTHAGGAGQYAAAFLTNSTGVLTIGGNINPAAGSANGRTIMHGGGVINVIGEVTAHATPSSTAVTISGSSATPFIATLNVTGSITASATNAVAIGAGTMTIVGSCTAANGFAAIESSSNSAAIRASGSFICATDGTLPIYARKLILNTTPTAARTRYALNGSGSYVDMFTADNTGLGPATNHVRSGVTYSGMTGTLAVPLPSQVAVGVATDNTVGTAFVTGSDIAAAVWSAATRSITGGLVDTATTLTNAPTVPTPSQIASQVRTELTSELSNLDASVSSRLAGSAYTAPTSAPSASAVATAVRTELGTELGRIDQSISSRLASADYTTPPTTAQISAAVEGSLLNETDGQAVLNAIVGAIGNTNLSEVSLVAAVRADLERSGGKLDSIPTTAAPTAAQNATAVWGAATRSVTGGTVDTLTNAPASVTPSDIWSHSARTLTTSSGPTAVEIRQEMDSNSTKLANLDSTVSSRLAGSAYTAPSTPPTAVQIRQELDANSTKLDVAVSSRLAASEASKLDAVKAKTDALPIERLQNCATTSIVGNLIAQANS